MLLAGDTHDHDALPSLLPVQSAHRYKEKKIFMKKASLTPELPITLSLLIFTSLQITF